jgi:hypothetical protein
MRAWIGPKSITSEGATWRIIPDVCIKSMTFRTVSGNVLLCQLAAGYQNRNVISSKSNLPLMGMSGRAGWKHDGEAAWERTATGSQSVPPARQSDRIRRRRTACKSQRTKSKRDRPRGWQKDATREHCAQCAAWPIRTLRHQWQVQSLPAKTSQHVRKRSRLATPFVVPGRERNHLKESLSNI